MILHENRLQADDFHKISCLIGYFCRLLQIIGGALRVKILDDLLHIICNDSTKLIDGFFT